MQLFGLTKERFCCATIPIVLFLFLGAPAHGATCQQGSVDTWINTAFPLQTGQFTANYDATPGQADMDGVVGLSLNAASNYANLATITRFSSTGAIDTRNGGNYTAAANVPYTPGLSYHFRLVINPSTGTYSIYVTPPGGSEITLGLNYAFRSEQASTSSLNNWSIYSETGTLSVCNMAITSNTVTGSAPTITTQPASQTVNAGQTVTFSVTATGTAPLSYQWEKNGTTISGATSSTYTTPATTTSDNGSQFTATVSNPYGTASSTAAKLAVNGAASCVQGTTDTWINSALPLQTGQFTTTYDSTPSQADMDGVVGLSLNAASNYANLATITRFSSTGAIDTRNGGNYTAAANVPYTPGLSYHFRLVINPSTGTYSIYVTPPGGSEITLGLNYAFRSEQASTSSLNNWSIYSETGTLSVCNMAITSNTVTGSAPTITTQPASQTVNAGQTVTFSVTATGTAPLSYQWEKNGTTISGATSSTYTTPATTTSNSGSQFTVVVSNSAGSTTSNPATLTVDVPGSAPTISSEPASQTVPTGQSATFSVTASGTVPLAYQWSKNGTAITGATSASYKTPATTSSDNGSQFMVVVSNSFGTTASTVATLTVGSAPTITTQPASQTVNAGQTVTFSVTATGTAPLSYQWEKNGTTISGATSSTYTTPATTTSDNGSQFTATVSNPYGTASSTAAKLAVNGAASCVQGTTDTWINSALPLQTGQFTTTYDSTPSQADMDGVVGLSLNAASNYANLATITRFSSTGAIDTRNGGNYTAAANVPYTPGLSYHFRLVINPSTGTYSIYVTPPGGSEITLGLNYAFRSEQASTSSLNNWSIYSETGTLSVCNMAITSNTVTGSAPTITTQPASQTVNAGQTVTFSVTATGTAPLSYQWERNGTTISGATSSSYTTPATTTSNSGSQFTVVVSNSAGSTTSTAAILSVNAAANTLTATPTSLSFGNVATNGSNSLSVKLTNSGSSTITISNVSISGPGFNDSGVSSGEMIGGGQTATLTVTFAPSGTGNATGGVTITISAGNSPLNISLSGTGVQSHSVALSWSASNSSGVVGYNIYRGSISGGPYTKLTTSPVTGTNYMDSSVTSGQTYYYVVTAVGSNNTESPHSNETSATIP